MKPELCNMGYLGNALARALGGSFQCELTWNGSGPTEKSRWKDPSSFNIPGMYRFRKSHFLPNRGCCLKRKIGAKTGRSTFGMRVNLIRALLPSTDIFCSARFPIVLPGEIIKLPNPGCQNRSRRACAYCVRASSC